MLYQVLKHKAQPSVLGLVTTRIVNYSKNFTLYLSILTPIFSLRVISAKKTGRNILPSLFKMYRPSLNINFFCFLFTNS